MLNFYVKTGIRFSIRDKRLFEITEVEITRVDCVTTQGIYSKASDEMRPLKIVCSDWFFWWSFRPQTRRHVINLLNFFPSNFPHFTDLSLIHPFLIFFFLFFLFLHRMSIFPQNKARFCHSLFVIQWQSYVGDTDNESDCNNCLRKFGFSPHGIASNNLRVNANVFLRTKLQYCSARLHVLQIKFANQINCYSVKTVIDKRMN